MKNLKPWMDYIDLLRTYQDRGYLEVLVEKHEAFITSAALWSLVPPEDAPRLVRRLRLYAAWRRTDGRDYLQQPFALHVVDDGKSHDPLLTVLLTRRRRWWRLWRKGDKIDVITYK